MVERELILALIDLQIRCILLHIHQCAHGQNLLIALTAFREKNACKSSKQSWVQPTKVSNLLPWTVDASLAMAFGNHDVSSTSKHSPTSNSIGPERTWAARADLSARLCALPAKKGWLQRHASAKAATSETASRDLRITTYARCQDRLRAMLGDETIVRDHILFV